MNRPVSGFVYLVHCPSAHQVKIGFSVDPQDRYLDLERTIPVPICMVACVPGTTIDEGVLHTKYSQFRKKGEWFSDEIIPELVEIVGA